MSYGRPRPVCRRAHAAGWQRTAIALMGFGFVVERFGLFLRMVTQQPLMRRSAAFRCGWAWRCC